MKSIVNFKENNESFPMLLINHEDKFVVMFVDDCEGTIIASNDKRYKLGEYRGDWNMDNFDWFDGTIELVNE